MFRRHQFQVFLLSVFSCTNWIFETQGSDDDPSFDTPLIYNGTDTTIAKWPFMASIRGKEDQGHGCGAVVLNDNTIITAAHCLLGGSKPQTRFLALGQTKLLPLDNNSIYEVSKFINHPQHNPTTTWNDLGVIKLARKIDFKGAKGRIGKVCLPTPDIEPDGAKCVALGWGGTPPGTDSKGVLQQVNIPITPCNKDEKRPNMICAGYWDKPYGICFGDSGGPLLCPPKDSPNKYLLYGLSSVLLGECGKAPGGFTKVADYLDWIKKNAET